MAKDFWVTVYDNLSSGREEFIQEHLGRPRFHFVKADLLDLEQLTEATVGQDLVFHMAANPDIRASIVNPWVDKEQGILCTFHVLEAMRRTDVRKIAFASSSAVYGEPTTIPTPEDYGPLLPISIYGASKLAGEGLITSYCHTFGMQSWIFRFANIVGRRSTHGVLWDFLEKLRASSHRLDVLGDGRQAKSYLGAEECVDAMWFVVTSAKDWANVFNLGNQDSIQVSRIADIVIEEMGLSNIEVCYSRERRGWKGDVTTMNLATDKLRQLGWKATHNSEETIRLALKDMINASSDLSGR
jgi:UDP-glucose 4-epimerase